MSASWTPVATVSRGRLLRAPLLVGVGGVAALTLLHVRDPHDAGSYGYCPYLLLTGHPCPGCGGLRAANLLTNGDWIGALSSNAMAVGLLLFLAGAWLVWLVRRGLGSEAPFLKPTPTWAWLFLAIAVVFGIARLTPAGAWLAP
ncbi:DUF2752 domain-containing protein [uncultured Aeromicrobium sp.]|uniref:DUF2752 domain-containing protein n=1 Tax=uncultured Aeromicrobium sp. TaxID=337820 RepID=UPI0025FE2813|nr:DUF2752 domain-containing protein [uncultured Aeromicrobium sp.]